MPRTSSLGFEVQGIYSGRYLVRVRAVNASDVSSVWATSPEVNLTGKVGNPPKPVGFIASDNVVFGIELNWGFPANTDDTLKTEIQYSPTGTEDDAMLLADVPIRSASISRWALRQGKFSGTARSWWTAAETNQGIQTLCADRPALMYPISPMRSEEIKDSEVFKDLIESAVTVTRNWPSFLMQLRRTPMGWLPP